jgi:peptide chain release factor 1
MSSHTNTVSGVGSAACDWDFLEKRSQELSEQLIAPALENAKRAAFQKELSYLTELLSKHRQFTALEQERASLEEQKRQNKDPELTPLFEEELQLTTLKLQKLSAELDTLLFPADERDNLSVFLEIRAGTGGQEAALFAADLLRMYTMYALNKGWRASVVSESPTDLGGYREVILSIEGKGVYGYLKFESGVHRVQRVPATETSGRIHTSTATVAVLPESEEVEHVDINPADLRIDVYRAGGAGGQHVNKTDSAVRITHIPSGLVVACQEERSQHKNKAKALKVLKTRLLNLQRERQEAEISQKRREQVGGGTRAEKARTYNYPQNRVTDHTINLTLNKLDMVMEGDLDDLIQPLREHEQQERRKHASYPFTKV